MNVLYLQIAASLLLALIGISILVFAADPREYAVLLMAIGFALPFVVWISIEDWFKAKRRPPIETGKDGANGEVPAPPPPAPPPAKVATPSMNERHETLTIKQFSERVHLSPKAIYKRIRLNQMPPGCVVRVLGHYEIDWTVYEQSVERIN